MQNQSDINGIQASILRQLFRKDGLRFAQVNVAGVPSDQFSYHLRQLIKYGLIEKAEGGTYSLSAMGKTRTIMLYPNKDGFIEQGFLATRVVLSKMENGEEYFLLRKRTIVPYKGTYGTPGDKILFGEDVAEAAVRTMRHHTGLVCDVALKGIRHIRDDHKGNVVQDKYFFVFAASNPRGTLTEGSSTGTNVWLTREELVASGLSIQGGLEILDMAVQPHLGFSEVTLKVETY